MNDAPKALDEFLLVKKEILSNEQFLNDFSNEGNLFLNTRDTSEYNNYNLVYLKEWFRNGRGYISLKENDTSFCFKECESRSITTAGYIYNNRQSNNYKTTVQLIDSLNLGSGWFAHIIKCKGCNDLQNYRQQHIAASGGACFVDSFFVILYCK